jgi:hypothetical protein
VLRYVRRHIGQRVRLRLTPEVRFVYDTAVERGERVLTLLSQMKVDEEVATARLATAAPMTADATANDGDANSDDDATFIIFGDEDDGGGSEEAEESDEEGEETSLGLEGVGDPEWDEDVFREEPLVGGFAADMFQDANPEMEKLEADKKQWQWQQAQANKRKYKKKSTRRR